jgi:hypothetical protein
MQSRELYIPTVWRIKGTAAQVYDVLSKSREFPRWWPEVYRTKSKLHKRAIQRGFEGLQRELARLAAH